MAALRASPRLASPPQERPGSPVLALFGGGGTRRTESLATQAERRIQETRTRKGTQVRRGDTACACWSCPWLLLGVQH